MSTADARLPIAVDGLNTVTVPRGRWGKPLIIPRDGGAPVPYYRTSSFGDVLDDTTNLTKWKIRKAIAGVAQRPDLYLTATTLDPDVDCGKMNALAEQAIEHAGGSTKSNIGSAVHTLTERIDVGGDPFAPAEYHDDLRAYRESTGQFEMTYIERFMVCDELGVAGTPDRLLRILDPTDNLWTADDRLVVGDLKTSSSSGFLDKHTVQLAIYAHSDLYDPVSGTRTPLDIEQGAGLIFHLPAGQGRCDLYELDLDAGWEGALLAADVRAWRKRKGICTPRTAA